MQTILRLQRANPLAQIPKRATPGSSGMDLYADHDATVLPGTQSLIGTGIIAAVPVGYEIQVRSRSGLALKHGITVLNSPGTVDSDYRGVIGVILFNHSRVPFEIKKGDRIAQMVVCPVAVCEPVVVHILTETERGAGGFGSSGV